MNAFDLKEPETLEEALDLLDTDDPSVRCVAGGTALMLMMKSKLFEPETLVSLHRLRPNLRGVHVDDGGALHLGPLTTLRELELSPVVQQFSPVIPRALKTLANVRVRNVATVGGHLAHGDPHMDLPPIFMALDARVKIQRAGGVRELPLSEFLTGYYSTALDTGELITEVIVPPVPQGMNGTYLKFTALSADDWPMVGVAAFVKVDGDTIADARVVVSAATEKATRLTGVETRLAGVRVRDEVLDDAAELAVANLKPLADIRGSSAYKREIVKVCVRKSLKKAAGLQREASGTEG
ncbi:xanthine dehydrogenase family protein subunit M [Alicyclobacillus cycloheptanicus]|uniref:Carbon-monoxide dehydrogenase medium subunit n=1 Tax=Alicyclobacillus cycloheptanicus TaxID=1457 RepID=A0ABT9XFH7_9BACL|nr:xanthine dehydrogenase family protein subunit M [Alicyclobacillus cycloheptanicus]MDQ0189055.1 carbon-monoxide dehydrogenase medium subunit [Alicyclobacillus cycloheptanicus]WDM00191.1 xanthine dehydrogenase family protein subunit M [Alicyclobacillus cycloheptanicus]